MALRAKRYSGDGVIRICSTFAHQGYAIEFPRFRADRAYAAVYKLSYVPNANRAPQVYLHFHSDISSLKTDSFKERVTAALRVVLADATGREIQRLDLPLSMAIWSQSGDLFGIYDLDRSDFHFDPASSYTLRVSYTPGPVPPPTKELYFEIDCCAYY